MTVTLTLTPEQEQRLSQAAQARGVDMDCLLHELINVALARLEPVLTLPTTRTPDLHAGQYWISDDFDTPLPDSFWLGEE